MRLLVTTPVAVVVDADDVRHVRAEDETGAFGILPGHGDLVTVLAISVISWRDRGGEHHLAVRGGVLTVHDGALVEVASREAVSGETLRELRRAVLARFRDEERAEEDSRISLTRLQVAAIRSLQRYLQAGRMAAPRGEGTVG